MVETINKKKKASRLLRHIVVVALTGCAGYFFSISENRANFMKAVEASKPVAISVFTSISHFLERHIMQREPQLATSVTTSDQSHSRDDVSDYTAETAPVPANGKMPPPPIFMPPRIKILPPPAFFQPPKVGHGPKRGTGKPVQFAKHKLNGVPFYLTIIDLKDPDTFVTLTFPHNCAEANSADWTTGDENFETFVTRYNAAVLVNGTFFSKDQQKRVMGNIVSEGVFRKYSPWENFGTTLGIGQHNELEMVTARADGPPDWNKHWFSLTCGPRLLRDGEVWLDPEKEGFKDSHVLGIGPRAAIGYPKSKDKLYLVTFLAGLSLENEAKLMKGIGCVEAMNLDGGASKALAHEGKIVLKPGRPLTNVLVVYDRKHPAPASLIRSWDEFQYIKKAQMPQIFISHK